MNGAPDRNTDGPTAVGRDTDEVCWASMKERVGLSHQPDPCLRRRVWFEHGLRSIFGSTSPRSSAARPE
jgi:hypothetical protein